VEVPLEEVATGQRTVPLDDPVIRSARSIGTCLGVLLVDRAKLSRGPNSGVAKRIQIKTPISTATKPNRGVEGSHDFTELLPVLPQNIASQGQLGPDEGADKAYRLNVARFMRAIPAGRLMNVRIAVRNGR
jgi:hypothetical protein